LDSKNGDKQQSFSRCLEVARFDGRPLPCVSYYHANLPHAVLYLLL